MFNFLKKKKAVKMGQIVLGLDLKRCSECMGPTRPCAVNGSEGIFHRWVDAEKALLRINTYMRPDDVEEVVRRFRSEGVIPSGCGVEKQRTCLALVEWPSGAVTLEDPRNLIFLDREG